MNYRSKTPYEKMKENLYRKFNAEIHQVSSVRRAIAPTRYYRYDDRLYPYEMDYHMEEIPVYSIQMTSLDMEAFFDYIHHLENRVDRYEDYTDAKYFVDHRYDEFAENAREEKLRRENPALQDAWEQYQALKIMLEN